MFTRQRNASLLADFYKVGHPEQLPPGITWAASSWIPRKARDPEVNEAVVFGWNYFFKEYLLGRFESEFFQRPERSVIDEYRAVQHDCLGIEKPNPQHIVNLHNLGYMPLEYRTIPEGTVLPMNTPHGVVSSTHPEFAWLPQYLETTQSNATWRMSTNAGMARRYRKQCMHWARQAGERDFGFVDWQCHDFSYRGMSGTEDAEVSGMAHLLSFSGTDTVPAILAARDYYGAPLTVGGSVPATEHWVMCAWIASVLDGDGELEGYRELLQNRYPNGIVSIVSDTRDLWDVLTEIVPQLRETILSRKGNTVFRPDSGDPSNIVCGDPQHIGVVGKERETLGALRILARELGTIERSGMLPLIHNAGSIYGDSITLERNYDILKRIVTELHMSPYNQVFGVGSFTYAYNTRDTLGWKLAPAAMIFNGELRPLQKKPATDSGAKHSYKGLVVVDEDQTKTGPERFSVRENASVEDLDHCAYQVSFRNSEILIDPKFDEMRSRVREGI